MEGLRTTIVLLALFIGAAVAYYFVSQTPPSTPATDRKVVEELDASHVWGIKLEGQGAGGQTIVLAREGGSDEWNSTWHIRQPIQTSADSAIARQIVTSIANARQRSEVAEPNLTAMGLEPGRLVVTLTVRKDGAEGETEDVVLRFGNPGPFEGTVYLLAEGRVMMVQDYVYTQSAKTVDDLRDRRPFPLTQYDVRGVRVDRPEGVVELAKEGMDWQVRLPYQELARNQPVDELLSSLFGIAISRFIDAPEPPATYGLDQGLRVALTDGEGHTFALTLGREVGEGGQPGQIYGRRGDEAAVVVLNGTGSALEKLRLDAETYRARTLVRIGTAEVAGLSVRMPPAEEGGAETAYSLVKRGGVWRFETPDEAADGIAVADIVTWLRDLEWMALIREAPQDPANHGLAPPAMTVRLRTALGEEHVLEIGKPTEHEGRRYVRRGGSEAVFEAAVARWDDLAHAYPVLRSRSIVSRMSWDATAVQVTKEQDGQVSLDVRMTKDGTNWTIATGGPAGRTLDAADLQSVVTRVSSLSASRIPPPLPDAEAGLDHPWLTCRIEYRAATGGDTTAEPPLPVILTVGRPVAGTSDVYAKVEGTGFIFAIPQDLVDLLNEGFLTSPAPPPPPGAELPPEGPSEPSGPAGPPVPPAPPGE